ncbi:hypothetical protein D8674_020057 [Pyrus ussuriensis x Pyrus communis]|uniref:Uncharacterized protein n=1 Tax=Pyrus ussuriensis x Pyrus communis TaxID=2448454 RepID=A0A5N5HEK6_9ROSA|nr:hypothetical protein D8674_020057 [Pyrus ussuriensis x Pyrus communis]
MSHLIRTRRPVASTPNMTTTPTTAATAPAKVDHRPVNTVDSVGPPVPQAQASSTSSMSSPTAKVTRVTNGRILIGYDERHQAAPTTEQHSALAHNVGRVMRTFCPIQTTIWRTWTKTCSCTLIGFSLNATSNGRVTCTNVSSSLMIRRSLSRRVVQRSWKTDKIVEEESVGASGVRFPASHGHADRTFGRRLGTYCRGMGNAKRREITGLRSELALYKSQMSMLVQARSSSGIHLPDFSTPSPSQPFHTN